MLKFDYRHPTYTMIFGLTAAVIAAFYAPTWYWWVAFGMYMAMYGLGQRAGFHSYFCHKSYEAPKWWVYLVLFLGTIENVGPCSGWVAYHRMHHKFSDDPNLDPSAKSLLRGLFERPNPAMLDNVRKASIPILRDPLMRLTYHHHTDFVVAFFLFLCSLAWLFNDPWIPLFWWLIPAGLSIFINEMSGLFGHGTIPVPFSYRRYNTNDKSINNAPYAIISAGEGLHNNHHRHPNAYHNAQVWWEWFFDWPAWFIWMVKKNDKV